MRRGSCRCCWRKTAPPRLGLWAGWRLRSARPWYGWGPMWTPRRCGGCLRWYGACRDHGPAGRAHPARGPAGRLQEGHGWLGGAGSASATGRSVPGRCFHLPPQTRRPGEDPGLRRDRPGPVREEAGSRAVQLALAGGWRSALERGAAGDLARGLTVAPVTAPRDPPPEHGMLRRSAGYSAARSVKLRYELGA